MLSWLKRKPHLPLASAPLDQRLKEWTALEQCLLAVDWRQYSPKTFEQLRYDAAGLLNEIASASNAGLDTDLQAQLGEWLDYRRARGLNEPRDYGRDRDWSLDWAVILLRSICEAGPQCTLSEPAPLHVGGPRGRRSSLAERALAL
jgi:hypothetical protein